VLHFILLSPEPHSQPRAKTCGWTFTLRARATTSIRNRRRNLEGGRSARISDFARRSFAGGERPAHVLAARLPELGLWRKQDELKALAESSRTVRQFFPRLLATASDGGLRQVGALAIMVRAIQCGTSRRAVRSRREATGDPGQP